MTNLSHDTIKIDTSPNKNKFVNLPSGADGLRTKVRPNDILISITADIGMIGLVPVRKEKNSLTIPRKELRS